MVKGYLVWLILDLYTIVTPSLILFKNPAFIFHSPHCRALVGYNFEAKCKQSCNHSVLHILQTLLAFTLQNLNETHWLTISVSVLHLTLASGSAFLLSPYMLRSSLTILCSWRTAITSSPTPMCSGSSCKRTRPSSHQCLNPVQPILTSGVE